VTPDKKHPHFDELRYFSRQLFLQRSKHSIFIDKELFVPPWIPAGGVIAVGGWPGKT
jgi:hypothetical protein